MGLVAITAYLTALPNAFVWDDENLIVANPLIKAWSLLPELFGSPLQPNTLYYRPLQGVVHLLAYQTFGLWAPGFHVVSVVAPKGELLAVRHMPGSATPEQELAEAGIDRDAIVAGAKRLVGD